MLKPLPILKQEGIGLGELEKVLDLVLNQLSIKQKQLQILDMFTDPHHKKLKIFIDSV